MVILANPVHPTVQNQSSIFGPKIRHHPQGKRGGGGGRRVPRYLSAFSIFTIFRLCYDVCVKFYILLLSLFKVSSEHGATVALTFTKY